MWWELQYPFGLGASPYDFMQPMGIIGQEEFSCTSDTLFSTVCQSH